MINNNKGGERKMETIIITKEVIMAGALAGFVGVLPNLV